MAKDETYGAKHADDGKEFHRVDACIAQDVQCH